MKIYSYVVDAYEKSNRTYKRTAEVIEAENKVNADITLARNINQRGYTIKQSSLQSIKC